MQKQEKRRELRLKRFWRSPKTTSSEDSTDYHSPTRSKPTNDSQHFNHLHYSSLSQNSAGDDMVSSHRGHHQHHHHYQPHHSMASNKPTCSLPLLQVWPSQDSPRGEADGQSFIFPIIAETSTSTTSSSGGGTGSSSTTGGGGDSAATTTTTTAIAAATGSGTTAATTTTATTATNVGGGNQQHCQLTLSVSERRRSSLYCDTLHAGDSGIDSVQASPSPNALPPPPGGGGGGGGGGGSSNRAASTSMMMMVPFGMGGSSCHVSPVTTPTQGSPNLSLGAGHSGGLRSMSISVAANANNRRKSSALLHPDHARLFALRMKHAAALERAQTSPDQTSIEDMAEFSNSVAGPTTNHHHRMCSASSSTTSSLTSVAAVSLSGIGASISGGNGGGPCSSSSAAAAAAAIAAAAAAREMQQRISDPWLQAQSDREREVRHDRRRSSTMTARYSLFDALDLEYALLRAAARGSVGPYSLSESINKLTFTQSLAFPALARGLATKRRRSTTHTSTRPLNPNESGLNTCAKVLTAIILVTISFMVFLIVYKFVRT